MWRWWSAGKGLNCYEGSHKQFDSWCDHGCLICALIPDGKHHPTYASISYEEGSVIDIAIDEQFVHQTSQGLLTYVATGSLAEDSTDCSCFRSSAIELYLLNCLRGGGHVTNLVGNYDNGRLPWSLSLVASVLARVFLERRGVTKFWSASRMALLFRSSESSNPILSWACTLLSCGWAEGGCRQGQE